MSRLSFESVQSRVFFKQPLPANTEIALHNIAFRRIAHSFISSSKLRFELWVTKRFSYELLLPEVDITLNFDFYADFHDFKKELEQKLIKKTQHLPESEYYAHFLTRIRNLDGFFSISKNDDADLLDYTMEIDLLNSNQLKKYLLINRINSKHSNFNSICLIVGVYLLAGCTYLHRG